MNVKFLILCAAVFSGLVLVSVLLVVFWFIKKRGRSRKFVFEDVGMIPKKPPVPHENKTQCLDRHSSSNLVTRKAPSIPLSPLTKCRSEMPSDRQRQIEEIKDEFFGGIYASVESLFEESGEEKDESVKNNNNSSKPETAALKSSTNVIIKRAAPDPPKVTLKPPRRSTSITKINPNIPQRTTSMKTK